MPGLPSLFNYNVLGRLLQLSAMQNSANAEHLDESEEFWEGLKGFCSGLDRSMVFTERRERVSEFIVSLSFWVFLTSSRYHLREMQHLPHSSEFTTIGISLQSKSTLVLLLCIMQNHNLTFLSNLSIKNIWIWSYRDKRRSFFFKSNKIPNDIFPNILNFYCMWIILYWWLHFGTVLLLLPKTKTP